MARFQDGMVQVRHEDVCTLCGTDLMSDDMPLILTESGRMEPMKKDPNFLKFVPDHDNEDDLLAEEDALVEVFHADCLVSRAAQYGWGRYSPTQCDVCEVRFLDDVPRWAFRFRCGSVDFQTSIFVADENPENMAIVCPHCFEMQVGGEVNDSMIDVG